MKEELKMRYFVTTLNNCLLHGFEEWQEAVTYCNNLDITTKLYDNETGITIEWDKD